MDASSALRKEVELGTYRRRIDRNISESCEEKIRIGREGIAVENR
jgi:hypothetical protein